MKGARFVFVVLGAGAWLAFGCGSDDDASAPASGGKGTAGANARGGAGGVSGSAGASGVGAHGGNAGSAGVSAGAAGRGGSAGAGGMCANEVPRHKIGDACPTVTTAAGDYGDTLTTNCGSSEEACKMLDCGEPWSAFDENGCYRKACYTSASCASGERCVAPILVGQTSCISSTYGDLSLDSGCECVFAESGDCSENGYCLPLADYPPANDCVTAGKTCDELIAWATTFEFFNLPGLIDTTDLQDAFIACQAKVEKALGACPGESGFGGSAGEGGMAGAGGVAGAADTGGQSGAGAGG